MKTKNSEVISSLEMRNNLKQKIEKIFEITINCETKLTVSELMEFYKDFKEYIFILIAENDKKINQLKLMVMHDLEHASDDYKKIDEGRIPDQINSIQLSKLNENHLLLYQAIERLVKGTFGTCTKCKKNIKIMRLLMLPQSDKCTSCATTVKR